MIEWADAAAQAHRGKGRMGDAVMVLTVEAGAGAAKKEYLERFKTLVAQVPDILATAAKEAQHDRLARIAALAIPTPEVSENALELWNLKEQQLWKNELAREFRILSSTDVAKLAQSSAKNIAATANRWKSEQRIFSVTTPGGLGFPGFQFDLNGQPRAVVREILARLDVQRTDWAIAFWFTAANGRLDGARPVDRMDSDPEAVVAAAAEDRAPGFG